jgi:hypothetical protein
MKNIVRAVIVGTVMVAAVAGAEQAKATTIADWLGKRVQANSEGIKDESTVLDKILKPIGPSVRDIEKYGLCGGPNSVCRKPFGNVFGGRNSFFNKMFGGDCSFFHKPLGC